MRPSIVQVICRLPPLIRDDLGTAIVFVESNLDMILALAEQCVVMEKGRISAAIPAGYMTQSVRQQLMIGHPAART